MLRDASLSVSESLGQAVRIDGRSFGHVIDPRSGWPVETQRLAAVRAPSGAQAEVWSTALLILPADEGRARILAQPHLEALWIEADGRVDRTPGFQVDTAVGLHERDGG